MRIGFDGGCLANLRGFGRFARHTLQALAGLKTAHRFVVVIDRPSLARVTIPDGVEVVAVDVSQAPSQAASAAGRRRLGDLFAMGRAAARARLDLMYFPATYSAFPVWNVGRVVVTMHDTLALAHPQLVFRRWQGRLAWTIKEHLAVRRADHIMTVSQAARRDLLAWFRLAPDRVSVMSEGPDPVFGPRALGSASDAALARYGVDPQGRFLLYVGGLSPHKNLPRLVEAFARSGLPSEGYQLALVGDTADVFHTDIPAIQAATIRHGVAHQVVMTGFIPDDDLVYLYNRAEALVQPSLMEGFGLPPVEAMACGRPIVASTAGSLPEVIGDAGLFFDPTNTESIANALRLIVDDPGLRLSLSARARARASQFTWGAAAQTLLERFDRLAGPRLRGPHRPMRSSTTTHKTRESA